MMPRVANKIALVTGAASVPGLGSAIAQRLAEEGAMVYLTDVDAAGAEAVAAGIRGQGGQAVAVQHDVTSTLDWDRVFARIISDHGRLDVLVNNAGIAVLRMIDVLTSVEWARQLDVNLTSMFHGTQRAVREMRRTGRGGSIINMSSVCGLVGLPGCSAYGASKGGVLLFTKSIALETARDNIRVNSVHPGVIWTNMQKVAINDNKAQADAIAAAIPMGAMGDPVDIANAVLFLASDESRYMTGAGITVDGGLTAQWTESAWTLVCASTALEEGRTRRFQSPGRDVLLARVGGTALAVDNICTHAFACLHEGRVRGTRVICPLHGASFDLRSGGVLGKPASVPLQCYITRENSGNVEVLLPA